MRAPGACFQHIVRAKGCAGLSKRCERRRALWFGSSLLCFRWIPMKEEEAELRGKLQKAAGTAFVALRGCSYGRCDFRVDLQGEGLHGHGRFPCWPCTDMLYRPCKSDTVKVLAAQATCTFLKSTLTAASSTLPTQWAAPTTSCHSTPAPATQPLLTTLWRQRLPELAGDAKPRSQRCGPGGGRAGTERPK